MIRFLSSIKFAFWSLMALIIWIFFGSIIANFNKKSFSLMNDMLIIDWFLDYSNNDMLIQVWFLIFCFIGALLLLSFCFCTFTSLRKSILSNNRKIKARLMFYLHFVFILVVLLHVASMVLGFKIGGIDVFPNSKVKINNNYTVEIIDVNFVDSTDILINKKNKSKIRFSKENFSIEENFVEFILYKNEEILTKGKSYLLNPYVFKNIRFTIESFIVKESNNVEIIGVKMVFSRNPILIPFFVLYGLVVVLLVSLVIVSWNRD